MKKRKNFKKLLAVILCLSILTVTAATEPVQAKKTASESAKDYINRCYKSIKNLATLKPAPKVIAIAYLVGEDDIAAASWLSSTIKTHELYAVDPDTKIQGHQYDSIYFPQDNREYLMDIKKNYGNFAATSKIYNMSKDAQYIEREGCRFTVVACDEKWVTIWDRGYQSWSTYYASGGYVTGLGCRDATLDGYLETHPAGFYKIQRKKVSITSYLS